VRATWAELLGIAGRATLATMLEGSGAAATVSCGGRDGVHRLLTGTHTAVKTVDADQKSKQQWPMSVGLPAYVLRRTKATQSSVVFQSSRWLWFRNYFLAAARLSDA